MDFRNTKSMCVKTTVMTLAKYVQLFAPGYAEHMMIEYPGGGESTGWRGGGMEEREKMQQFPMDPKFYIMDMNCVNGSQLTEAITYFSLDTFIQHVCICK